MLKILSVYSTKNNEEKILEMEKYMESKKKTLGDIQIILSSTWIHPDDKIGKLYMDNEISCDEIFQQDSRKIIKRLFAKLLVSHKLDKEWIIKKVIQLEKSCYNYSIIVSKECENPPVRSWNNLIFTNIYSTRCGIVASLIDIKSKFSAVFIDKLKNGLVIDNMTEKELCPESMIEEKMDIERRNAQVVPEKVSNLFKCPHCKERKCTYKEVQKRCLDEAPDYLCYCLNCNHRFTGRS